MIATAAFVGVLLALLFAWVSLTARSPHRKTRRKTRRKYDAPLKMDALDRLYREADAEEYDLPAVRGRRRS